ncbi:hypothetical protein Tco_0111288 [Tanacetum coccineum]
MSDSLVVAFRWLPTILELSEHASTALNSLTVSTIVVQELLENYLLQAQLKPWIAIVHMGPVASILGRSLATSCHYGCYAFDCRMWKFQLELT